LELEQKKLVVHRGGSRSVLRSKRVRTAVRDLSANALLLELSLAAPQESLEIAKKAKYRRTQNLFMARSPLQQRLEAESPFLRTILANYRMKLKSIGDDNTTNPVVKADINLILEKISASEEETKLSHVYLNEYMERHREVVCQALSMYVEGLKKSRDQFYERLQARPEMRNLQNEIDHAGYFKAEFCSP
jgi:hypothetical protein